jgi:hypothetical protein
MPWQTQLPQLSTDGSSKSSESAIPGKVALLTSTPFCPNQVHRPDKRQAGKCKSHKPEKIDVELRHAQIYGSPFFVVRRASFAFACRGQIVRSKSNHAISFPFG